jgi:putative ABC transport system substrate-binding protein
VRRRVDALVTSGGDWGDVAKAATKDIPIVAIFARDPVRTGLVASLGRPEGNITGAMLFYVKLMPKRLEMLHELIPAAKKIAYLTDPQTPDQALLEMQPAAVQLGIDLPIFGASTVSEIDQAFARMEADRPGALLVAAVPFLASHSASERVIALAAQYGIPAGFTEREQAAAGGLSSYGTDSPSVYRQLGIYTGRVLRGDKPSELPILQPATFDLVLNLKTAKKLGLTIPPTLLVRADEVIE